MKKKKKAPKKMQVSDLEKLRCCRSLCWDKIGPFTVGSRAWDGLCCKPRDKMPCLDDPTGSIPGFVALWILMSTNDPPCVKIFHKGKVIGPSKITPGYKSQ